jgi:hypothetical protein
MIRIAFIFVGVLIGCGTQDSEKGQDHQNRKATPLAPIDAHGPENAPQPVDRSSNANLPAANGEEADTSTKSNGVADEPNNQPAIREVEFEYEGKKWRAHLLGNQLELKDIPTEYPVEFVRIVMPSANLNFLPQAENLSESCARFSKGTAHSRMLEAGIIRVELKHYIHDESYKIGMQESARTQLSMPDLEIRIGSVSTSELSLTSDALTARFPNLEESWKSLGSSQSVAILTRSGSVNLTVNMALFCDTVMGKLKFSVSY